MTNGKQVIVKVTDRGPFGKGKIVDLSYRAASEIGMLAAGVVMVEVEVVNEYNYLAQPKQKDILHPFEFDIAETETDSLLKNVMQPVWQKTKPKTQPKSTQQEQQSQRQHAPH